MNSNLKQMKWNLICTMHSCRLRKSAPDNDETHYFQDYGAKHLIGSRFGYNLVILNKSSK